MMCTTSGISASPSRRDRFLALGAPLDVPLVAALEVFAVVAARLVELRIGAHVAALGARLGDRLVPADEVAVRVVLSPVERLPALLRAPLRESPAVLWAL